MTANQTIINKSYVLNIVPNAKCTRSFDGYYSVSADGVFFGAAPTAREAWAIAWGNRARVRLLNV